MTSAAVAAAVAAVVGGHHHQTTTTSTMSEDGQQSLESFKQDASEAVGIPHASPKSSSARQSITQNTFSLSRFDSMEMSQVVRSPPPPPEMDTKSGGSSSSTLTASHRPAKPHIRINDYFALPSYLQHHFGGDRHRPSSRQAAVNFLMRGDKQGSGGDKCTSSRSSGSGRNGSPAKSTLAVLQLGNRGGGNVGGRGTLTGHSGHSNADPKQVSSESLAAIPNKGIYKVFSNLKTKLNF